MANSIQSALKNCVSREVEKLKKYDWNANSEDNVTYLIGGAIIGIAAVTLIANAGGISDVPAYVNYKTAAAQVATRDFLANHAHAVMGFGGSVVGAGAIMFLKGLKEENKVLRNRVAHAFNKLGHGLDYIKNVDAAYDAVISNNAVIKQEVDAERKWISSVLANPTREQSKILAPTGAYQKEFAVIETLKAAYMHGVKKLHAEGIEKGSPTYGKLGNPSMAMEKAIISGMLDYYVAADRKAPSVINKLHFVLVGDPDVLKSPARANELTSNAINAILELKGKAVAPREPQINEDSKLRRPRVYTSELGI